MTTLNAYRVTHRAPWSKDVTRTDTVVAATPADARMIVIQQHPRMAPSIVIESVRPVRGVHAQVLVAS